MAKHNPKIYNFNFKQKLRSKNNIKLKNNKNLLKQQQNNQRSIVKIIASHTIPLDPI